MIICGENLEILTRRDFYHRFTQSDTDFTTDWTRENINLCESVIICGEHLEILQGGIFTTDLFRVTQILPQIG